MLQLVTDIVPFIAEFLPAGEYVIYMYTILNWHNMDKRKKEKFNEILTCNPDRPNATNLLLFVSSAS